MARPVFGQADPRAYQRGPLPELARPGAVLAVCRPPGDTREHAREHLARIEARGDPCYRCIANIAPVGAQSAACGFLASARVGFGPDRPTIPEPDPDGFGL